MCQRNNDDMVAMDDAIIAKSEKVRFFARVVTGGKGSLLRASEGGHLIDLSATWTAAGLGYADSRIAQAVCDVLHDCPGLGVGSVINPQCLRLAKLLLSLTKSVGCNKCNGRRVYFGHSGSDANDVALRLCRVASEKHGGGRRVVAFEHSYHGGFGKALGISGVQVESGATPDDCVSFVPYPNVIHPHGDFSAQEELDYCLDAVEKQLQLGDVACIIVEPILSDGGVIVPPNGFLLGLRLLCDRFNVPLVCDEVKIGLGRSGNLYAYQYEKICPDVVTLGKALGGGLPISAVIGPASIMDCAFGCSLLTMGGNPICAAAATAYMTAVVHDGLVDKARADGEWAKSLIEQLINDCGKPVSNYVVDVRGRGLAIGVELAVPDGSVRESERFAEKVCFRANELGVIVYYVGGHVLEITPALTIDRAILQEGIRLVIQSVLDVSRGIVNDSSVSGFGGW